MERASDDRTRGRSSDRARNPRGVGPRRKPANSGAKTEALKIYRSHLGLDAARRITRDVPGSIRASPITSLLSVKSKIYSFCNTISLLHHSP